ncbi:MAG TPA: YafY family protein [Ilumatobacteraceae bacterium]|nr:YafY family protein [Ilumatobacteraceae bacterium]
MTDPTARVLELLNLLQTHRHWKGGELAERLGVSERTVRRDVDRLRQLGYPVDAGTGVDGGYRLAVGTHVPPMMFDDDEAIALVVGLRSTAVSAIDGIQDASVALMAKLDVILPDRLRRRVDAFRTSMEVMTWSPGGVTVSPDSLTVLSQGCRDGEEVRFDYARRDGEESRRLVQPHQLVSAGRRWYLVAWDVRRSDWRTFRVDRMESPALAGARFERREVPGGDAVEFVRQGLRSAITTARASVLVHATPAEIDGLRRWLDAEYEKIDEAHTRLHLQADSDEWLASMVAMLATRCTIEIEDASDSVRTLVTDTAARLAAAGER